MPWVIDWDAKSESPEMDSVEKCPIRATTRGMRTADTWSS